MDDLPLLLEMINNPRNEGWTKADLKQALLILKELCQTKAKVKIDYEGRSRCGYCLRKIKKDEKKSICSLSCVCQQVFHQDCLKLVIFGNSLDSDSNSLEINCPSCDSKVPEDSLSKMLGKEKFAGIKDWINGSIFRCDICLCKREVEKFCITLSCEHRFCSECLKQDIETKIDGNTWPIRCCIPKCETEIDYYIIKHLISEHHFTKYDNTAIQKLALSIPEKPTEEVLIRCPNADCQLIFFIDKKESYSHHTCERCKTKFCVNGCPRSHDGLSCEKFRQWMKENNEGDRLLESLIVKQGWARCPKCKMPIEKTQDCPHMHCKICMAQFCYICKVIWGTCQHYQQQELNHIALLHQH